MMSFQPPKPAVMCINSVLYSVSIVLLYHIFSAFCLKGALVLFHSKIWPSEGKVNDFPHGSFQQCGSSCPFISHNLMQRNCLNLTSIRVTCTSGLSGCEKMKLAIELSFHFACTLQQCRSLQLEQNLGQCIFMGYYRLRSGRAAENSMRTLSL